jgi:hypothetical protein
MGNPIEPMLTPGQDHDVTCAEPLIKNADPAALIGDKAYDADPFVETLTQRGISPVIPPKANETSSGSATSHSIVNAIWSSASSICSSTSDHRHTLPQACEKFPCRGAVGCRYNPPQLNTGPRQTSFFLSHHEKLFREPIIDKK